MSENWRDIDSQNSYTDPVLIVQVASNLPSGSPDDATSYSFGDTIGNGTVVFKGDAAKFKAYYKNRYPLNRVRPKGPVVIGEGPAGGR